MPGRDFGLVFDPRGLRFALALARARLPGPATGGRAGPLRLAPIQVPEPFTADWVVVEPAYVGICGSDVTQVQLRADADNPLSGLVSFPHVMGHEIVGRLDGEWVAIDPWLGCRCRQGPPCESCQAGLQARCARLVEPVAPGRTGIGMHLGTVHGLPGGFATRILAHRSQCRPLPGSLEPATAVLADPLAVALHAVESAGVAGRALVVVLGAGTIGLCATALVRHLHPDATVLVSAAWPHLAAAVRALGAQPVAIDGRSVTGEVAARRRGREVRPWLGPGWLAGDGADAVIDAVGSPATAEIALRAVRPGGRVVRVGSGRAGRLQAALHQFKEVAMIGSSGYRAGDLDRALALLAAGVLPADRWLTHRFPLGGWRRAFATAATPRRSGGIKVVLQLAVSELTTE